MNRHEKINRIIQLTMSCRYCHPLSSCFLSYMRGKKIYNLKNHLAGLDDRSLERFLCAHEQCPHNRKVVDL